jgi:hypothetical protein
MWFLSWLGVPAALGPERGLLRPCRPQNPASHGSSPYEPQRIRHPLSMASFLQASELAGPSPQPGTHWNRRHRSLEHVERGKQADSARGEVHLHFHGRNREDVTAIVAPVNREDRLRVSPAEPQACGYGRI